MARDASVCVLLCHRRRLTLCIHWDTKRDVFMTGQWFKGEADLGEGGLSPNGKLMACSFADFRRDPAVWQAISCPPFFTALAFFPTDTHTRLGYFVSDDHFVLPERASAGEGLPIQFSADAVEDPPSLWVVEQCLKTCPISDAFPTAYVLQETLYGDYHPGRELTEDDREWLKVAFPDAPWDSASSMGTAQPEIRHRTAGAWHLTMESWVDKTIFYADGVDLRGASWADIDQQGRLVFAREGRIYSADKDGVKELLDTNPFTFEEVPPPDWALEWP